MSPSSQRNNSTGITLIELLVYMSLFVMVVGGLVQTMYIINLSAQREAQKNV